MKITVCLWKDARVATVEVYEERVEVTDEEIEKLAIDKWRKTHPAEDFPLAHWEIEAIIP
jgi:hypothetical protein